MNHARIAHEFFTPSWSDERVAMWEGFSELTHPPAMPTIGLLRWIEPAEPKKPASP